MTKLLIRVTAILVSAVMLLGTGAGGGKAHDVKSPADCVLNFAILSDSHIEANNYTRYKVYAKCLRDVKKHQSGTDAVVFLGDNTMNGNPLESMFFHGTASLILKDQKVLPVLGNHDIGNGQGDYAELQNRWYTYTSTFFGYDLAVPYYCEVIDGYYFIVLGTQEQTVNSMTLGSDQLTWLQAVLDDAACSGKPAFVFSHHPERASYRADPSYPESLTDILTQYAETHDLFYFSGHTHRTLTSSSIGTTYNFTEVSLPCLTKLTGEKDNIITETTGCGVEVEVYNNEVVIRGRNFYAGEWATDGSGVIEAAFALKTPITE